jgi:hypothetical protein
VVDALDDRVQNALEEFEVQQQTGVIEFAAAEGYADFVVVAVRVFALALVIAEEMPASTVTSYIGVCSILWGKCVLFPF